MVTGGWDRAVRLWTRYVTTRPVVTLQGHRATVLDVAIYQPVMQIFSYSGDAVSHWPDNVPAMITKPVFMDWAVFSLARN